MLTQLDVRSTSIITEDPTDPLTFHLGNTADLDKIQVHNIDGIGPLKATINTSQYGDIDGSYFTGSSFPERNIVLSVGYNPDWGEDGTIEDLRLVLYQYFMPKQTVSLTFKSTHLPDVIISGYVESMEPDIFAQDPEVQISIICTDPAFYAVTPTVVSLTSYSFMSAGVTADSIGYLGSLPAPMLAVIAGGSGSYTGLITFTNGSETFSVTSTVSPSDAVVLQTQDGGRAITHVTSSTEDSLMNQVTSDDVWLQIKPGQNLFMIQTTPGAEIVDVTFVAKFGGI